MARDLTVEGRKVCMKCRRPKLLKEFFKDKVFSSGLHPYCQDCYGASPPPGVSKMECER